MSLRFRLGAALITSIIVVGVVAGSAGFFIWSGLDEAQRVTVARVYQERWLIVAAAAAICVLAPALLFAVVLGRSVGLIRRMGEETRVIAGANPAHRLGAAGGSELEQLAAAINELGARFQSLQQGVTAKIDAARADAEEEKRRLATLVSQLTQAVIVCNAEGEILLYNESARQLLNPAAQGGGLIGLGRSIFPLIDRNLIAHSLDNLEHRARQAGADPVASFTTTTRSGQLVRVQIAPVLDWDRRRDAASAPPATGDSMPGERAAVAGYVLTLEDVTRTVAAANRVDALVQSITTANRASLANIRTALEALLEFPDLEPAQRQQLAGIIDEEVRDLSTRLDQVDTEYFDSLKNQLSPEHMLASDLAAAAARRIETKLGIGTRADVGGEPFWLRVDSYLLVQTLTYLASRLKYEFNVREVGFRFARQGRLATIDLSWTGESIPLETWRKWETQPLRLGGEASPLNLKAVMQRHGGEAWYQAATDASGAYFRLLFPAMEYAETERASRGAGQAPLERMDLDLLGREQTGPIGQHSLAESAYTVFAIETTGPDSTGDASGGDEIISIGAVRIVNGRLLHLEQFEQLIDPQSPVSAAAAARQGIDAAAFTGQPTIEQALPAFYQFSRNTILVAHEGASAIRLLRAKEARTGTRFAQPVLDTLALSKIVHPHLEADDLAALAQRLGVHVADEKTALARASLTAEVFLKLVALLQSRGVATLKDVEAASEH